jgi:predicted aspartyl protease
MKFSTSLTGLRFAFAAIVLMIAASASAQFNASLSGTVFDSTKAAIPGATVTLTNNGTQQTQTVTSSSSGSYQFNELAPGTYTVTVKANGFQQNSVSNVAVVAETPRSLDVTLPTGQETQTVTVNADTLPELQTNDANIGRSLSSDEIERLPIVGADPYELLRTAPGITGDGARSGTGASILLPNNVGPGGSNSGIYQTENQIQISADGQRVADNNILIDGVSVNSLVHGGSAVVTPNQEAVANLTVVSTSFDAADGRNSGAQVKVTTKSGTNQIHGSLNFIYDEPGLNAFNRYGGPIQGDTPVKDSIKQRIYAASLGGPIVKNKLFLFASYQGYGQGNNTVSGPLYVDTAQYRAMVISDRPGGLSAGTLAQPRSQRLLGLRKQPRHLFSK